MGTVLVTGGCGVIGSWVCRRLAADGIGVVAFDAREDRTHLGSGDASPPLVQGDVRDLPLLISMFQAHRVQAVVHLAAVIAACEDHPYQAIQVNVGGTVNVLEAARLTGCRRIVFATSRAALGPIGGPFGAPEFRPVAEGFPGQPVSVYGTTKLATETICAAYGRRYGLDTLGLRFPAMYGPGRLARHGGYAVLCRLIEAAAAGQAIDVPSGGDQADDVLFVGDAAAALALAVRAAPDHLPTYHISSGALVTPRDFVRVLRRRFPGWQAHVGGGAGAGAAGYPSYCRFDDSAARRDLGYEPAYDLEGGIEAYLRVLDPGRPS